MVALVLALSPASTSLLAQDSKPYDVVLIKETEAGGVEDAVFIELLAGKIEEWVGAESRVLVLNEHELSRDRLKRAKYLKDKAKLSMYARIVKIGGAAMVTFRIEGTDASANSGPSALDPYRYSKSLEPIPTKAEQTLERILKTVVTPMLIIYKDATHGTQILADCIRSGKAADEKLASEHITSIYPYQLRKLSGLPDTGIHGLNNDQVAYICLSNDDNKARKLLSHDVSVRRFFDRVIYGDLVGGAEKIYLTVESHHPRRIEHHTIEVPHADLDTKANELAKQILDLISNP